MSLQAGRDDAVTADRSGGRHGHETETLERAAAVIVHWPKFRVSLLQELARGVGLFVTRAQQDEPFGSALFLQSPRLRQFRVMQQLETPEAADPNRHRHAHVNLGGSGRRIWQTGRESQQRRLLKALLGRSAVPVVSKCHGGSAQLVRKAAVRDKMDRHRSRIPIAYSA